jgi:hypothetical protein
MGCDAIRTPLARTRRIVAEARFIVLSPGWAGRSLRKVPVVHLSMH